MNKILDALSGTAVRSPQTGAGAERLASASSETDVCLDVEGEQPQPPTGPNCYLPAVLRDRPIGGRGRGAPPPVPPRSPRRPTDTSSSRGGHGFLRSNFDVCLGRMIVSFALGRFDIIILLFTLYYTYMLPCCVCRLGSLNLHIYLLNLCLLISVNAPYALNDAC